MDIESHLEDMIGYDVNVEKSDQGKHRYSVNCDRLDEDKVLEKLRNLDSKQVEVDGKTLTINLVRASDGSPRREFGSNFLINLG
ncbi:MAG: hypothetical protein SV377_02935 [Halobacteria archaeon]|nr:hypothetical protein [Halobacteria archaeon]